MSPMQRKLTEDVGEINYTEACLVSPGSKALFLPENMMNKVLLG